MNQILDGRTRPFFAGGWLSFWGDGCGSHRLAVMGPYGREPSFCNAVGALVISARIGVNMSDKVNIPPSNTRATQTVRQRDQIDGGRGPEMEREARRINPLLVWYVEMAIARFCSSRGQ